MRILLLLALLGAALLQPARAEPPACSGQSLLPALEREQRQAWDAAAAEFRAVPNGTGVLWRIEKQGAAPSWLFGTMHVPPQDGALGEPVANAFQTASIAVFESTEVLALADDPAFLERQAARSMLEDGRVFDAGLSQAEKDAVGRLTAAHGIPYFVARRMQPWFLEAALAIPPCVKIAILQGEPVLDQKLHADALAAGKEVIGLESAEEQLTALASLDPDIQLAALVEAAMLGVERLDDLYATMLQLYGEERVALMPVLLRHLPDFRRTAASVEDMEEPLIVSRNRRMRDRLVPILNRGSVFVAVGALHLSGETGLVELLQAEGFRLSRARPQP